MPELSVRFALWRFNRKLRRIDRELQMDRKLLFPVMRRQIETSQPDAPKAKVDELVDAVWTMHVRALYDREGIRYDDTNLW